MGKSVNADMLRNFLEISTDPQGQVNSPVTHSYNYELFRHSELYTNNQKSSLKTPLLISSYSNIIDAHLGRYPVVYFSLGEIEGLNDADILEQFGAVMSEVFNRHKYVLKMLKSIYDDRNKTTEERLRAKSNFKVFKKIMEQEEVGDKVLGDSLKLICKMLYMYFQKRVVVIINEYDLPYHRIMHTASFPESDLRPTLKFFNHFFGALSENNKYLERALLTGTYHFSNVPRAMTAVKGYNIITNPWPEYFGFTEKEVQELYERNRVPGETLDRALLWYRGYRYGANLTQRICNPYSIANFLRLNDTLPFLGNRSSVDILQDVLNIKPIQRSFELLVNNNTIDIDLNLEFSKKDTFHLRNLFFQPPTELDKYGHDLILSYVVASGYLGVMRKENATSPSNVIVEIPNKELITAISRKIMLVYYKRYGFTQSQVDRAAGNLAVFLQTCHYQPSRRLLETLQDMLDHLPTNIRQNEDKEAPGNVELVYSILNFISIKLRHMYKISSEVYQMNSTTFLITWKKNISSIVAMQFKADSVELLLEKARQQAEMPFKYGYSRLQKFIGINLGDNKRAEILAGRGETEEV